MVRAGSEDPRRLKEFPAQLLDCAAGRDGGARHPAPGHRHAGVAAQRDRWRSRWAVRPTSCSTRRIARAAGFDLWREVISQRNSTRCRARFRCWSTSARSAATRWSTSSQGRPAGDRQGAARRRSARWRGAHLHRRDARRTGRPAGPARARRRGDPPVAAPFKPPAGCGCSRKPRARRRRGHQARRSRGRHGRRPVHRARRVFNSEAAADRGARRPRRIGSRTATWW